MSDTSNKVGAKSSLRVWPSDGREIGLCVSGQRRFCSLMGKDFRKFVREGIDLNELEEIDDVNARRLVAHVRQKRKKNG